MKKIIVAAFAVLMCAASAMADLSGTNMTLSITHDQFTGLSAINNVNHTYGGADLYTAFGWGDVLVTSPAPPVPPTGTEHSLYVNFANFSYIAFVAPFPAMGTIKIHDIAEPVDLASVKILVNGLDIASDVAHDGNGFRASWSAPMAYNGNPFAPSITVAWNSMAVPAPGPAALMGLAGLVGLSRRRRARHA